MVNGLINFRTWTENPRVGGSIPPLATIKKPKRAEPTSTVKYQSNCEMDISRPGKVGSGKSLLAIGN
jgi:hypothetical protein